MCRSGQHAEENNTTANRPSLLLLAAHLPAMEVPQVWVRSVFRSQSSCVRSIFTVYRAVPVLVVCTVDQSTLPLSVLVVATPCSSGYQS